jgi:hypothetical protein
MFFDQEPIFWVGFFGAFIQLVAFVLNLRGKLSHDSNYYAGANAVGCCMTASYAYITGDVPFLMLEVTWGLFAFHKWFGLISKKKKKKA